MTLVITGEDLAADLNAYVNAMVDAGVTITLYPPRTPTDALVSIAFGKERITLEFCDVESLERLRDLAQAGAEQLRAAIAASPVRQPDLP